MKNEVIPIILILLVVAVAGPNSQEETFRPEEFSQPAAQPIEKVGRIEDLAFIDPFGDNDFTLDLPGISDFDDPEAEECIDTYLLSDISCADRAAVIAFRKDMSETLIQELHSDIDRLIKEQALEQVGMHEA